MGPPAGGQKAPADPLDEAIRNCVIIFGSTEKG